MATKSTSLKNKASLAKRTATALRGIAADNVFDIADQGVLMAAAKIVDSFGHRKEREAKQAKAEEAKYERDNKAARAKIEPAVRALPNQSISEKVALACIRLGYSGYLVRSLSQPTPREIQWELDYYAQQATSDIIANAAYWVATGKGSAEQAIKDIQDKHAATTEDPATKALAARFVESLKTEQVAA